MLLSRVADRIYWAARYMERAEDTARLVRAHGELAADLPAKATAPWEPLIAVVGSESRFADAVEEPDEQAVVSFLVTDRDNPASVTSCVLSARENLRTTRETVPRDGWMALNDLSLYVSAESDRSADRRVRDRFLTRVISDSRRLDGVLATSMTHDEAYVMWRLGRALERADMTTRVLGVRAAEVLALRADHATEDDSEDHDEVQWMGLLRSLSGLQMYQRAVRGPIEGPAVVRFLLEHDRFPRSVRALLREIRLALSELPDPGGVLDAVDRVDAEVRHRSSAAEDSAELDDAMDAVQLVLAQLDRRITDRYLRVGS